MLQALLCAPDPNLVLCYSQYKLNFCLFSQITYASRLAVALHD